MKAAKRSILICVLTLILSVSLLAGVTFAWFTDSITNSGNTIQSGELAIDATAYDRVDTPETDGLTVTIDGENVASGTYYFEAEGASLRNGDPVITEENWQPGDMNAKLFTVSNEGSIDAVVSLDFFVSGDLAEAMWYDFIAVDPANGTILGEFSQRNDLTTLQTLAADREFTLSPAADLEDGEVSQVTFLFVYGLPTSATNEAMNKAVNVNVVVSAKQNVEGAEGPVVVNPGTDLSETTIDSGDTILLSEGDYEVSQPVTVEGKQNIVIDGNGATIKASSAEGASIMSATSKSIAVAADTQTDLANNIINVSGATNVTIRNLTIVGALHHGINIWECENVVIENVTIINSDATAITINGSDVTLNSVTTSGSAWGGVNVDIAKSTEEGTLTTLTVDENCAFGEYLQIYADNATIADKVTVNATGYNKYTVTATDGNTRILWTNDSAVTEGTVFVDDAARLETAVANGGYIMFAGDINFNLAFANLAASVSINLNGYTLTTMGPVLEENASLTVENGNLAMSSNPFTLKDGSKLNLNYVNATSDYTIVLLGSGGKNGFSAEGAVATIENCIFYTTDPAAVATNASKQPWKCDIIISGSKITCDGTNAYYQYDNCPVYMNVNGNLAIEDSVITGQRQGVMVRTGTATIKNTTIISTGDYNRYDCVDAGKYENQAWADGNNVPAGALVVGNRESNAYNYETNVTLENCIITSQYIEEVPAIYIWGNATEEIGATLTVDEFTWTNKTGALAGDPAGTYGDVTVNLPEGYTLVDSYEELATAVTVGGYVVLANDIAIVPAGIGDALIPQMNINENTTLYLNGKTLSFDKTATTESLSYTPAFFGVMSGATLTIYGDGVIDAEAGYNAAYGINVSGGNLVINGGTYYGAMSAVQVQTGTCTINGGYFDLAETIKSVGPDGWGDYNMYDYLINCIDANFSNGTAVVYVKGGTFVNFDPSASQGEPNAPVSFVDSENYTVESAVQENGETWYTVVPKA